MSTRIQLRRGTAAQWTTANPTLAVGEAGFETDTNKVKIGDGVTDWAGLAYFAGGGGGGTDSIARSKADSAASQASAADSKGDSSGSQATTADSKGDSASTRASVADSKAVSDSLTTSTADSKAVSAGSLAATAAAAAITADADASIADSKAESASTRASAADSKAVSDSINTSVADSKAESAATIAGGSDSLATSTADSKGVSAGGAASVADSKAVSDSLTTSTADSKAESASTRASVADSKAVSDSLTTSTADSKGTSAGSQASVADSKAVSDSLTTSTADSKGESASTRASVADSKAVSDSILTSTADSKGESGSTRASVADSKAVSDSILTSSADSKGDSSGSRASVADSKAVSDSLTTSSADSKGDSSGSAASVADSKAVSAAAAAAQAPGAGLATFLVSGGQVVWSSAYSFLVSTATYYINGVLYTSPQTTVTLDAADATLDRLDAIVVNTSSAATKVTGTAASQPVEPNIDLSTQLELSLVLVTHNTSAPPTVQTQLVYDENVGASTEWNWTSSGSGWSLGSTNNPYNGSKDIEATTVSSGAYVQGTIGSSSIDPNNYSYLTFFLRSKGGWSSKTLQLRLLNAAGAVVGSTITIGQGTYGFDSTQTASYQQLAIPTSQFNAPSGSAITKIQITRIGSGTIGFYLDFMNWIGSNGFQSSLLTKHNILSVTHADTVAAAVVRGDVIVGNSTPAWNRLALGSNGKFLGSDGSDATWKRPNASKLTVTASDATSISPNSDSADITYQANTQAAGTLTINADAGTPVNGQSWVLKVKSTNVQTFSWGTGSKGYAGGTIALPTSTSGGGLIDYFTFIYDTVNSRWHYTGTGTGF